MSKEQLLEQVLGLELKERAEIAHKLLLSLDEPTPEENERLWLEVAAGRIEDIKTGKVKTIPGEEVRQRVRDRLSR